MHKRLNGGCSHKAPLGPMSANTRCSHMALMGPTFSHATNLWLFARGPAWFEPGHLGSNPCRCEGPAVVRTWPFRFFHVQSAVVRTRPRWARLPHVRTTSYTWTRWVRPFHVRITGACSHMPPRIGPVHTRITGGCLHMAPWVRLYHVRAAGGYSHANHRRSFARARRLGRAP